MSPGAVAADREGRRSISTNVHAPGILERLFGVPQIMGRDFERAFDHQSLLVDTFFQQPEALADLRNIVALCNRIGGGAGRGRWCSDDSDLLSQIASDLFDRTCGQRMQLLQEAEEQQPRAERIDLARYAAGVLVD